MPARRTLLLLPLAAAVPARAEEALPDDLYRARTVVTGTDGRSRPAGFAACLATVLVKLTGDPAITDLVRTHDPAPLVAGFDYVDPLAYRRPKDDQGSYDRSYVMTVRFDRQRIDALAAALGRRPWRGERPRVMPVLRLTATVPPWAGDGVLRADDPARAPQREAFANAAEAYGIAVALPAAGDPVLAAAEAPDGAPQRMVIVGALAFREADFGWTGSWRTQWRGDRHEAGVTGVGFDVAFDRLLRGAVRLAAGTGRF